IVVRKQGSGTFVQAPHPDVLRQRFRGSLGDLIRESHAATTRDIEVEHDQLFNSRIAEALELDDPHGTVVRRTRMMADGPFAYTMTYLPSDLGGSFTPELITKAALMELLIEQGTQLSHAVQSIRAQLADAELCTRIDVELGAAVLYVERV